MSNEEHTNDLVQFRLTFSLDQDRFFRRTCPSCGRDFKTEVNEADLAASLQSTFQQMGLEIGAVSDESSEEKEKITEYLYCPYCEYQAKTSDTLTQTFASYLQRYITREHILPMMNKAFSDIADSFAGNRRRSKGLFSIEMKFEHNRDVLPPRPISGPEPPDMTIVELLCCNKRIKIQEGWYGLKLCPYCGTSVRIQ